MTHSGDYIVVHHPDSVSELKYLAYLGHILYEGNYVDRGTRPGGWHTLELGYGHADDEYWLTQLVIGSRAPAMIVSFFDDEMCAIRGLEPGPHAAPWAVRLHAASAPARYPMPKHGNPHPAPLRLWMIADDLLSGDAAVQALAAWSAATDGTPDRAALAALLAEEPEHFADDVVDRLLDTLGLSERVERWRPHLFHGWDDPVKLERSIAALQPGRFRALDCREHQDCFALVRRRPEGDYTVEYREQKSVSLRQTVTPSLAAVVKAMKAWARGEVAWREDFAWEEVAEVPPGGEAT